MTENEEWRPIIGYEGLYEVSNLGRVKSLGNDRTRKEKILSPSIDKKGYFRVRLSNEGKGKTLLVHRLVAHAFIPNPDGLPIINHKDENPSNNVVFLKDDGSVDECRSNLEWCTYEYNNSYGTKNERATKNRVQTMISKGIFDPEREYQRKNMSKIRRNDRKKYHNMKERAREYYQEWLKNNQDQLSDDHTKGLW